MLLSHSFIKNAMHYSRVPINIANILKRLLEEKKKVKSVFANILEFIKLEKCVKVEP